MSNYTAVVDGFLASLVCPNNGKCSKCHSLDEAKQAAFKLVKHSSYNRVLLMKDKKCLGSISEYVPFLSNKPEILFKRYSGAI
jgi:hypothetical protein